ncbi:hypothetical protein AAHB37_15620 [Glutamicibacter halophytocola]|uniref:hypothetical protein n=1 Tax=Glutamicibacter halophytocola TaxID=1933880 RepID=UPI00321B019E
MEFYALVADPKPDHDLAVANQRSDSGVPPFTMAFNILDFSGFEEELPDAKFFLGH